MYRYPNRLFHALCASLIGFLSVRLSYSQFPPLDVDVKTVTSPVDDRIKVTYRSPPPGTCTTIFPSQKQYTGHVSIPPSSLALVHQNYTINTFFWFIEAREQPDNAPLTIWLNGGPGSSSLVGLFQETGPCEVVEVAEGQLGTQARDWGWDRSSNVLYVDQPNQVGLSYDEPTNGSLNLMTGEFISPPSAPPADQADFLFLNGTFSSNRETWTTNTTQVSAQAIWHMLQGFLGAFPQYNPGTRPGSNLTGTVGINLFTESYGGKFGPVFASFWERQNLRRSNGSIPRESTLDIELTSLGIINGCVDDLIQAPFYPIMASNNTYGIQAITEEVANTAAETFGADNGCRDSIMDCRLAVAATDPSSEGDVLTVNRICQSAATACSKLVSPYQASGRSIYDLAHKLPDSFPPSTYLEYLNTVDVQRAIGSIVNYTETSTAVSKAFISTGDYERVSPIPDLSWLLSRNVRVALIYGDRDFSCNWLGGEAISFALAASLPSYAPFYSAGYAEIVVNDSYIGGQVRQFGNLSFSRIYDAGHLVPAYQPETAFTVFTRVIQGVGVALGKTVNLATFGTLGPANSTYQNKVPESPEATCWIRNIQGSCSDFQKTKLQLGTGVVINGVLYNEESDWPSPDISESSEVGTLGASSTESVASGPTRASVAEQETGVYVATGTIPPPPPPRKTTKSEGVRMWDVALPVWLGMAAIAIVAITPVDL
ncbi:MAG: hypothetical protein M1825_001074 [Sarcosagium campestre]|nr:MAG: hypothetical protein M1825_001074 [Sarcosagium campestre]